MKALPFKKSVLFLCLSLSFNMLAKANYVEEAKLNDPQSWINDEFLAMGGLQSIGAEYAYARGYNGTGVKIGIFDDAVFTHPEFDGRLDKVDANESYFSDDPGYLSFSAHGTHVAGIAAAARNGNNMHGVAYNAGLVSAKFLDSTNNYFESLIQSDTRVFNNSWGSYVPIEVDENGNNRYFPDGRPVYVTNTFNDIASYYSSEDLRKINALSLTPVPSFALDDQHELPAALLRSARFGKLIIFAAGNENNYNQPVGEASLPWFFPDVTNNFIVVTNLTNDDQLNLSSTPCGYTASYCLSAPGTEIYSTSMTLDFDLYISTGEIRLVPKYDVLTGTSMAAPMVSGAAAIVMQRFPYMTAAQISSVLLTTATDLGDAGIDAVYGWGKLNLQSAIDGPKMFVTAADIPAEFYIEGSYNQTQFVANIPGIGGIVEAGTPQARSCLTAECAYDRWSNDISGHGGLTKTGSGTLELTGINTYLGPTLVNAGTLIINGSTVSDVSVQNSARLSGNGQLGSLTVNDGGTVAPGNSIGVLSVARNVTFQPGSLYAVEINHAGESDLITSQSDMSINGGSVALSLENSNKLLSQDDIRSLINREYTILRAAQGITGQFDSVLPNYVFLGSKLNYLSDQVSVKIGRNALSFDDVAVTANQRAVARAAEGLNDGNPVYESLLNSRSNDEAQDAYAQLSGQLFADITASQLDNSRYLRDTLNTRLRQAAGVSDSSQIKADDNGLWGTMLGAWSRASGGEETSYNTSTYGFVLGQDVALADQWRVGVATGYSRTSLKSGHRSKADSDNYHLALYGSKQLDALALRTGAAYAWHAIDTTRSIQFGAQADQDSASFHGQTGQIFLESGYRFSTSMLELEPFANLAYVTTSTEGGSEQGGGAALTRRKQNSNATLSTLGVRLDKNWSIGQQSSFALQSELGWQHQFGEQNNYSRQTFKGSDATFQVRSVSASRDGMVAKVGAALATNSQTSLSLNYSGFVGKNHQDNSVNADLTWRF
ncbi:MAG: Extracellular serine protease [Candidatus Erwinia impunctatus]|nr:Extracellular serine protease [Culicoides impunctatus]